MKMKFEAKNSLLEEIMAFLSQFIIGNQIVVIQDYKTKFDFVWIEVNLEEVTNNPRIPQAIKDQANAFLVQFFLYDWTSVPELGTQKASPKNAVSALNKIHSHEKREESQSFFLVFCQEYRQKEKITKSNIDIFGFIANSCQELGMFEEALNYYRLIRLAVINVKDKYDLSFSAYFSNKENNEKLINNLYQLAEKSLENNEVSQALEALNIQASINPTINSQYNADLKNIKLAYLNLHRLTKNSREINEQARKDYLTWALRCYFSINQMSSEDKADLLILIEDETEQSTIIPVAVKNLFLHILIQHYFNAAALAQKHDLTQAVAVYKNKILALDPKNAKAWLELGKTYKSDDKLQAWQEPIIAFANALHYGMINDNSQVAQAALDELILLSKQEKSSNIQVTDPVYSNLGPKEQATCRELLIIEQLTSLFDNESLFTENNRKYFEFVKNLAERNKSSHKPFVSFVLAKCYEKGICTAMQRLSISPKVIQDLYANSAAMGYSKATEVILERHKICGLESIRSLATIIIKYNLSTDNPIVKRLSNWLEAADVSEDNKKIVNLYIWLFRLNIKYDLDSTGLSKIVSGFIAEPYITEINHISNNNIFSEILNKAIMKALFDIIKEHNNQKKNVRSSDSIRQKNVAKTTDASLISHHSAILTPPNQPKEADLIEKTAIDAESSIELSDLQKSLKDPSPG